MVAVKLKDDMSGSRTFQNISVRVLEWLVILVCCKIKKAYMRWRQENLKIHLSDYAHYNSVD